MKIGILACVVVAAMVYCAGCEDEGDTTEITVSGNDATIVTGDEDTTTVDAQGEEIPETPTDTDAE